MWKTLILELPAAAINSVVGSRHGGRPREELCGMIITDFLLTTTHSVGFLLESKFSY
jgi:hypothetical protein